jgi:hypothetical protein
MTETKDPDAPLAHEPPGDLRRHIDPQGRLTFWPTKRRKRTAALEWMAAHFERGRFYSEREVNEILQRLHSFGDWALLRRELFDRGYLDRESDGSRYWRAQAPASRSLPRAAEQP